MTQKFRITYATLSADNEELQAAYDAAVDEAKGHLGSNVPIVMLTARGTETDRSRRSSESSRSASTAASPAHSAS